MPLGRLMKRLHEPIYASRLRALVEAIVPQLEPGDAVLDVGCGFGALGHAIMSAPSCPAGVTVRGLERATRGGELIPVDAYDGEGMPHGDGSFDVVMIADVLHHDPDPDRLLAECRRVSRRLLIVKDHLREGPLAQCRLSFADWAANAPHGVPCLYRYYDWQQWGVLQRRHGLRPRDERHGLHLYPPLFEQVFGGDLQYFAVFEVGEGAA